MKPTRPLLAIRPSPDSPAAQAFLSGKSFPSTEPDPAEPPVPAPAPAPTQASAPSGRRVHERKDGRRVRRTTFLLEEDLAKTLDLASATQGVDKTVIVHAALRAWFSSNGG